MGRRMVDHFFNFKTKRRALGFAVLFCLHFGLDSHGQDQVQAQPQEGGADKITLCSYNLKNWLLMAPWDGDKNAAPIPKPEKEKALAVKFLCQIRPDILGICEIGTRQDLSELQSRLKTAGLDLPHVEFCSGGDTTRSLALLSRFPITARQSQTELSYQIGEMTLPMQRGILDATVEIKPGFHLRMLGVHLKSKRAIPEADEALMRRNEAHLLRQHMDGIFAADPEARVICYGDFNEHRNEPAISAIIGSRSSPGQMQDIYIKDDHGLLWTHFWNAADVYARLDYFFASNSVRPLVDSRRSRIFTPPDFDKASDHRPIILTLDLARTPRSRRSE